MQKEIISTDKAPAAIGPYSQAVRCGDFIFVSGQIPIDPSTGQIQNDIKSQTLQVMKNLEEVLTAAGSSLEKVTKTTLFIKNMDDFSVINEVYTSFFKQDPPARSTVEVARLPKDVMIEIEAIAIFRGSSQYI
ncbi:MAG: reactive intermediate/imine deaminase [Firmicutes bacterium HGW-Firmicutes-8]|nr:MAG: reactive intermediate/imine deaminase [Firmicutes bacterium HGW-Firmicutes-8]